MSEEENRLHRCCFTGHRPEKISATEEEVKAWLEEKIDQAIADGYTTFISGCAMGVDLWAAQIVQSRKKDNPSRNARNNHHPGVPESVLSRRTLTRTSRSLKSISASLLQSMTHYQINT